MEQQRSSGSLVGPIIIIILLIIGGIFFWRSSVKDRAQGPAAPSAETAPGNGVSDIEAELESLDIEGLDQGL